MKLTSATVLSGGKAVEVVWTDGQKARFHAVWLRDNAQDVETRSAENGQRLITLQQIPRCNNITDVSVTGVDELQLVITPEMKRLKFDGDWLRQNIYDSNREAVKGYVSKRNETWGSELQNRVPTGDWSIISRSDEALITWLSAVQKYGFAVLSGVPTNSGDLCQVAEKFGYIRETNYGRWFDVRSEVNPSNLAYTNLGLQAHTDNPYRDPVPTLQLLSCLENTVEGGDSIVVDGFHVASVLKAENSSAFELLTKYSANFEYAGSNSVHLKADRPMIELTPEGEIKAVSFNNRSCAPLVHVPYDEMEAYYDAYRRFGEIVENEAMQVSFKLSPGELFIVDNTRVMHARKAFSGTGSRWLQGCYADKDGLLSTLSILENLQANGKHS